MTRPSALRVACFALGALLVGCSSSSAGPGPAPSPLLGGPAPHSGLAGQVYAGTVSGVTVSVYSVKDGSKLGETTTNDGGYYAFDLAGFQGLVRLETAGGTALDPTTGDSVALPTLTTIAAPSSFDSVQCSSMITPLTELAMKLAQGDSTTAWQNGVQLVSRMAGGSDVLCSAPSAPGAASDDRRAGEHGLAIAALFQTAHTEAQDIDTALGGLATRLGAGDATALDEYRAALEVFLASSANQTGIAPGQSLIASTLPTVIQPPIVPMPAIWTADCGGVYGENPGIQILPTRPILCEPPKTVFPVTQGHPAPPPGSECAVGACQNRELVYGGSDVCIEAVVPPETNPDRFYSVCNWYLSSAADWLPCMGGLALDVAPFEVPAPNCANGTCKPLLNLVIPLDNNVDGTLLVHEGNAYRGMYRGPLDAPNSPWDLYPEVESCPSTRYCHSVFGEYLAIGTGTVRRTFQLLTTYGYEWEVSFDVPVADGARTYCDVFSGKCQTLGKPPTGGGSGSCASVCAQIDAACGASGCQAECEQDQAHSASCGQQAEWDAMLACCASADLASFCGEGGFDTCQKGACQQLRPAGAADGCP